MKTDYSNIGAVCRDCAKAAGFTSKKKAVGVWMGECEICHERKLCTHLHNDWNPPKKRDHFADVGKKVVSTRDEAVAKWNELTNKIKG
jgi:hypothetical protein